MHGQKYEANREEFRHGGPDVDYVLTTQELVQMIKESGIMLAEIDATAVDRPFGTASGAGVIFGVTGGVTEAALRYVAGAKDHNSVRALAYSGVRGMNGVKEAKLAVGEREVKIAVVSGLKNASDLIDKLEGGEAKYDFVEVMACPGGCIAGAGQPFAVGDVKKRAAKVFTKPIARRASEFPTRTLSLPSFITPFLRIGRTSCCMFLTLKTDKTNINSTSYRGNHKVAPDFQNCPKKLTTVFKTDI